MTSKTRAKGNRSVIKAINYYENDGWLVDKVEKTGKWVFEKDLFSKACDGFDLIGIKQNKVVFIQVKTNKPATQKTYIAFSRLYAGQNVNVEVYTWYDRRGPVIHQFFSNGKVNRLDKRWG